MHEVDISIRNDSYVDHFLSKVSNNYSALLVEKLDTVNSNIETFLPEQESEISKNEVINNGFTVQESEMEKFNYSNSYYNLVKRTLVKQLTELPQTNIKNDDHSESEKVFDHYKIDENLKEISNQKLPVFEENGGDIHQEKTCPPDSNGNQPDYLQVKTMFTKSQLIPVHNLPNQYDQNSGNSERFNAQHPSDTASDGSKFIQESPSGTNISSGNGRDDGDDNDDEKNRKFRRNQSRTEFERTVLTYVDQCIEMLKNSVEQSQIYQNIVTAFNIQDQLNTQQIIEIKDTVINGLKDLIYSNKPLSRQNDLLHHIFMCILIHSKEHSQNGNINCNVPFCRHLWEIYSRILSNTSSVDIVAQNEVFEVLYSNTSLVNHQMHGNLLVEGLDLFLLYANKIGKGGGGEVFDVAMMLRRGDFKCRQVIKKINKSRGADITNENLLLKLRTLRMGDGPYILGPNIILASQRIYCHIMDRWGVSLQQYISKLQEAHPCNLDRHFQCKSMRYGEPVAMPLPVFFYLFYQMMLAIQYIHSLGIIHFDIKPANFVLKRGSYPCSIKLIDLDGAGGRQIYATHGFAAYEIYDQTMRTSKSVDIFALGTCIPAMLGLTNMVLEEYDPELLKFRNSVYVEEMKNSGIANLEYFGALYFDCTKENMDHRPSVEAMIHYFESHQLFQCYRRIIGEASRVRNEDVIFGKFDTYPPHGEFNHDDPDNAKRLVTNWIEKKVMDRDFEQTLPSCGSVDQLYQLLQEVRT